VVGPALLLLLRRRLTVPFIEDRTAKKGHGGFRSSVLAPCLDAHEKLEFFHSLFITSIFRLMHEVVNVGKKITNYTV
jgi:hypothetical protein